jgi:hypothetical protein
MRRRRARCRATAPGQWAGAGGGRGCGRGVRCAACSKRCRQGGCAVVSEACAAALWLARVHAPGARARWAAADLEAKLLRRAHGLPEGQRGAVQHLPPPAGRDEGEIGGHGGVLLLAQLQALGHAEERRAGRERDIHVLSRREAVQCLGLVHLIQQARNVGAASGERDEFTVLVPLRRQSDLANDGQAGKRRRCQVELVDS